MELFIHYPFGNTNLNIKRRSKKVYNTNMENGYNSRKILERCCGLDPLKILPFIERIEQSSHNHYSVCFCSLIEEILNINIDSRIKSIRTILLETERIYSHILYLNRLFLLADNVILQNISSHIKELMINQQEEITGHRIYSASHIFDDLIFNFTLGNIKLTEKTNKQIRKNLHEIKDLVINNTSLISLFGELAVIDKESILNNKVTGPFAWISGIKSDLRLQKPYLVYERPEIIEILKNKFEAARNSAYSRMLSLIHDIEHSTEIIKYIVSNNNLVYQNKSKTDLIEKLPPGIYRNTIESPRGALEILIRVNSSGDIEQINIISPSDINKKILDPALRGTLIDYSQLAFESLYISTMEIDK